MPLVIRTPIVARMGMGPQHSQSLEGLFAHIPGLVVAMPSNRQAARRAWSTSGPVELARKPLSPRTRIGVVGEMVPSVVSR